MIPFTPLGHLFGFVPLPAAFPALMGLILISIGAAEAAKRLFYRNAGS
ncbi:MAG: hypothetical protein ACYDAA_06450 [Syntrophales bacterium]